MSITSSSADFAVALRDIRFSWPGQARPVLDIAELLIRPGERVFLSGPSGGGKSTLLGLIAGILLPERGSVTVGGTALHTLGAPARDRFRGAEIGFIFQQFNLVPYLSMIENVLIPCHLSPRRRARALQRADTLQEAAAHLLARLDLAPALWQRPVRRLSVGQQQRVAAARALIGAPPLLIADEPSSALDADSRDVFLKLLLGECALAGASLLFVSHDAALAGAFPTALRLDDLNAAPREETP
ncbi:MAG: ATP-binding cassette domain-containing protein [Azoarcus sp.]|jgi:putative ABC transport system ATP-binding protein|nr:ATP-binding cassette domain-containing protein [Azoarcus sp.]